jgi:hypothetical protein
MAPSSRAPRSGIHGSPASPLAEKLLSVELKPAGVDRNAATSSGEVPPDGDVESEHAVVTAIAAAAVKPKIRRIMVSLSERFDSRWGRCDNRHATRV